jgi:hypothetical protein
VATETTGADGGVVAVPVFPRLMPETTGCVKVVFIGALPDPAKGMSAVTARGAVAE